MNAPLLQPFSVVIVGTMPATVGTGDNANGVRPGIGVLNANGVADPLLPPMGAKVAGPPSVAVGTCVLVGNGVGELAAATWVKTSPKACVWIAPTSCVGTGVAPKLQELKMTANIV